jgi:AmiR/NasT family two-component response regulator
VLSTQILNSIRSLGALVVHPPDAHAKELVNHLSRIGCRTEASWPPPPRVPEHIDIVFLEVNETVPEAVYKMLQEAGGAVRPTLVGLAGYENPSVLQSVLELKVEAVITKPLRPYGILTSLVMARRIWEEHRRLDQKIKKLDEKVKSAQQVNRAKLILMNLHKITEEEAYRRIRTQAMAKRASTVEIAQAIINADGILGGIGAKALVEE